MVELSIFLAIKEAKEFEQLLLVILVDANTSVLNCDKQTLILDRDNDFYIALFCELDGIRLEGQSDLLNSFLVTVDFSSSLYLKLRLELYTFLCCLNLLNGYNLFNALANVEAFVIPGKLS